jgi:hypothetical protein
VQAEAPPGALFSQMRKLVRAGGMEPQDIAFYFTHWLTDLAGAEPTPLNGCEKFVLKFPHAVLISFIRSFSVLDGLAVKNETEVWALPPQPHGARLGRQFVQSQPRTEHTTTLLARTHTNRVTAPSTARLRAGLRGVSHLAVGRAGLGSTADGHHSDRHHAPRHSGAGARQAASHPRGVLVTSARGVRTASLHRVFTL